LFFEAFGKLYSFFPEVAECLTMVKSRSTAKTAAKKRGGAPKLVIAAPSVVPVEDKGSRYRTALASEIELCSEKAIRDVLLTYNGRVERGKAIGSTPSVRLVQLARIHADGARKSGFDLRDMDDEYVHSSLYLLSEAMGDVKEFPLLAFEAMCHVKAKASKGRFVCYTQVMQEVWFDIKGSAMKDLALESLLWHEKEYR